ncbi:unnamed protein product [Ectocarpus sp. 12 AP-2014]
MMPRPLLPARRSARRCSCRTHHGKLVQHTRGARRSVVCRWRCCCFRPYHHHPCFRPTLPRSPATGALQVCSLMDLAHLPSRLARSQSNRLRHQYWSYQLRNL